MNEGPSKQVKHAFVDALYGAISTLYPDLEMGAPQVELSVFVPDASLGDISSSVAFKLSKVLKKSPKEIAGILATSVRGIDHIVKVVEQNGYVNAFLDEKKYSELVISSVIENPQSYGSSETGEGQKVIIEFPSVNPAKPWHVGHLRNALLGDSVSRIFDFCGYSVEKTDYIDDLGLQVAESVWGYLNLGDKPDAKFDLWLGKEYVKVNSMVKEKQGEIEDVLKKMEEGNNDMALKARELAEKAVLAQQETAFSYGIYRNVLIWESDIVKADLLNRALKLAQDKGITEKPESGDHANCVVVDLEKMKHMAKEFENPEEKVKVLVRSNGVATYIAKDFAFDMWKFGFIDAKFKYKKFIDQPNGEVLYTTSQSGNAMAFGNADKVINVIGAAQTFPQLVLKAMLNLMDHEKQAANKIHLAYGEVSLESGTIHTRGGEWIGTDKNYTADDLLTETRKRATEIASKSEKITNKENVEKIANQVALAAIKLEYLRIAPEKGIVFSWKNALDFESNSGPYILYTYARASRLLDKAVYSPTMPMDLDFEQMSRGYDFKLVRAIGMAQEIVEKACAEIRPNIIADYLFELSSLFSKFYESMPVLAGKEAKNVRLAIVFALSQVAENMLALLGITPIKEM